MTEHEVDKIVLTIRLIRSFEHRNIKNMVVRIDNLNILLSDFKILILEGEASIICSIIFYIKK